LPGHKEISPRDAKKKDLPSKASQIPVRKYLDSFLGTRVSTDPRILILKLAGVVKHFLIILGPGFFSLTSLSLGGDFKRLDFLKPVGLIYI
jgi:hypothetical protein